MKKLFLFLCIINLCIYTCDATIVGKIDHNDVNYKNKVINSKTKKSLSNAKITIPEYNFTTYTDKNGAFQLNVDINDQAMMFVEKDGYKTFSLTIDNNVLKNPLKLGIEESSPFDLQVTKGIIHLGDNMFSNNSANSKEFKMSANGHFMSRKFKTPSHQKNEDIVVKIGTIIGIDTKKAKELGQNKIARVYSSPTEIYVNGQKIASIELNGDNFEYKIPKSILKEDNELVIKAGRNLFQLDYIDYDDLELGNVRIEVKDRPIWAKR